MAITYIVPSPSTALDVLIRRLFIPVRIIFRRFLPTFIFKSIFFTLQTIYFLQENYNESQMLHETDYLEG